MRATEPHEDHGGPGKLPQAALRCSQDRLSPSPPQLWLPAVGIQGPVMASYTRGAQSSSGDYQGGRSGLGAPGSWGGGWD